MTKNPLDSIQNRLQAIEDCLSKLDSSFTPNKDDVWEKGVEVATDTLQVEPIIIMQNIEDLPHFKLFRTVYFNRKALRDWAVSNTCHAGILRSQ